MSNINSELEKLATSIIQNALEEDVNLDVKLDVLRTVAQYKAAMARAKKNSGDDGEVSITTFTSLKQRISAATETDNTSEEDENDE